MGDHFRVWKPDLGGWLTMLNCTALLLLVRLFLLAASKGQPPPAPMDSILLGCLLFLSLPYALIFLFYGVGAPLVGNVVLTCLALGLNSFVWGYGLAVILRWLLVQCYRFSSLRPPSKEDAGKLLMEMGREILVLWGIRSSKNKSK